MLSSVKSLAVVACAAGVLAGCSGFNPNLGVHASEKFTPIADDLWQFDTVVPNAERPAAARESAYWRAQKKCTDGGKSAQLQQATTNRVSGGIHVALVFQCVRPLTGEAPAAVPNTLEKKDEGDGRLFGILD